MAIVTSHPPSSDEVRARGTIRMLDLFAGVGGLSEGFRQADPRYRAVKAVELEPRAAAGYALNHDTEVFVGSIQDWLASEPTPEVDLVIGGPPCQGFSALGARRIDDERNVLWRHYAEAVVRSTPQYFVLENVPQFHSSAQFAMFEDMTRPGAVLEDYAMRAHLVNAAEYGTAQIRRRVIVIGHRRDLVDPGFPEPQVDRTQWLTLRDVIKGFPMPGELPVDRAHVLPDGRILPGPYRSDELHVARTYSELSLRRFREIPYGGNRFDLPEDLKCAAWRKHTTGSGDVMGRLRWEQPSVTIRTEFNKPEKGRYLHPVHDRALSPHEGARIQGFPDYYQFVGPITQIVKQIGNAVPIPLGKRIGEHLAPFLATSAEVSTATHI
ncbi:DNA cytosine methyltransferase [Brachybacterium sp. p3-SID957]|uniref:DNA cytosine methyltransferase n=1 Tax=Brachybacterium sp. p3-SID957 TaxID=2916049 RepID=UPI00223B03C1|nr:DNA cytosine methyltransferase [Brachybacterium sp. p3-SID957]MCT1774481.1 DNA cytosine methyltransferase [Brachybacterium sp. p3-SID957]